MLQSYLMNKMRAAAVLCLLALAWGAAGKGKQDDGKVKVAVYYESLCPDSKQFVTSQLASAWRELRGAVKVKLVPYGKSTHDKVDGKWQFTCHHGPDECKGNKIQACILKDRLLADTDKMELIICLMMQQRPDQALDSCLSLSGKTAEAEKLKRCAAGEQGSQLLASMGDKTARVARPLAFVPTIVINEKFDQGVQDAAFKDLKGAVCRAAEHKPAACQQ